MERLTVRNSDGSVSRPTGLDWDAVLEKLAAYEDTGLEPGEIEAVAGMASENCAKTAAAIDRLLADEKIAETRADRIRAMSDDELAGFIEKLAYSRETPWSVAFGKEFCDNCPAMEIKVEGYSNLLRLHECDFVDGECPHGVNIMWWLQQPAAYGDTGNGVMA